MPPEPTWREDPVAAVDDGVLVELRLIVRPSSQQRLHHLLGDRRRDRAALARSSARPSRRSRPAGRSTGAKRDEPGLVRAAHFSAVPVLPATSMPCSAAAVPVPSFTTWLIIAASALAVARLHHLALLARLDRAAPSGRRRRAPRSTRCGRIRLPPLRDRRRPPSPSAAASPAGAPGRSPRGRCRPRRESSSSLPLVVDAARAQLVARQVDRRLAVEAEPPHVLVHRRPCRAPRRPGAQTVLTEFVSAVGERDRAEAPRCRSSTAARRRSPSATCRRAPRSGVKRPLSSAAVAVTTLKVEPGG